MSKPETQLQASILMAIRRMPGVDMERNAQKHTTKGRFGLEEGSADLVGCVRLAPSLTPSLASNARYFAIEVKMPGEQPNDAQRAWAARKIALGAYVCCARSVPSALRHLDRASRGHTAPTFGADL